MDPKATTKKDGWLKLPAGFVKRNVDANFDQDLLKGASGPVRCDSSGNFLAVANWKINVFMDVLSAEVMTLRWGLSLAQTEGCNKLLINSDNLEVVKTMKNGGRSIGKVAAIFYDYYSLLASFLVLIFYHCSRVANDVAHELTRIAMRVPSWMMPHRSFFSLVE